MKARKIQFILSATSALLLGPAAFAADGSWNNTAGGSLSWDTPGNWLIATADGLGFTADFSLLNVTADTTVTLNSDRTIGNLIFGDTTTSSAAGWILAGAGDPAGKLTLAGTTPTITVNALGTGKNTAITATMEGTSGFTKAGPGTLVLNNNTNTISGPVVVSAGILSVQSKPLSNASSVALNTGGTLVVATITGNAIGSNNDTKISFNGGTLQYNVSNTSTDYSARFSTDANQAYRINVQPSQSVTYSSDLASSGGTFTKLAGGTLVLAAANSFTGATTVSLGTLELSHALALQNSAVNTSSSLAGTTSSGIVLTGVTSPTFGGLTGNKALASLFDTDSGNYNLVTNVTLNPGTAASYSYAAAIADGATGMTLTKSGAGSQTLTAASLYTGATILNQGVLIYGNLSALSSGSVSFTGTATLRAGIGGTFANPISVATGVTGTFGNNSFTTTLSGPITGDGTFAKTGTGVLTLTGGLANTFSGGFSILTDRVNINDGLSLTNANGLITVSSGGSLNYSQNFLGGSLENAISLSGPGVTGFGALNLHGNVDASGPITLEADATISHNFNNATISGSITGTNRNLTLTTVNSAQPGIIITAPVTLGTGGITVNGAGGTNTVTLSGNNSYTGETRVATGTLILNGSARINDLSTVRIDTGAVLQLDFAGTDSVSALYVGSDPNPKPDGTYGSLASSATYKSAEFAGNGILLVGTPGNNYAAWAGSQVPPVTGGENGDDDNDGVSNLVEYALTNGGERGVFRGNTITFAKRGAPYGSDLTYIIETSETLEDGSWFPVSTHGPSELGVPISYDLNPIPGTPKEFARLKVVKTP